VQGLFRKYELIKEHEVRFEMIDCEDADIVVVAYGTTSRIVRSALAKCRKLGLRVGLLRPISLYPFPFPAFEKLNPMPRGFLVVEMSMGQMLDDVRIAVAGRRPVSFFGRTGGMVPSPEEIVIQIQRLMGELKP